MKLVRGDNATAVDDDANGPDRKGKIKKKSADKKRSDAETPTPLETTNDTAKRKSRKSPRTSPSESPGEDLDMTGWSGDYTLPK